MKNLYLWATEFTNKEMKILKYARKHTYFYKKDVTYNSIVLESNVKAAIIGFVLTETGLMWF